MTHRIEQVESILHRAVSQVLQRQIADPRIQGMISITRIKVSADMRNATVYVSVLPESKQNLTLKGLRHANRHIHALASKLVALRIMPRLEFRLDESLKKQASLHQAIQEGIQRSGDADSAPDESQPE